MREVIGKTPKLSPELKIYALDDETVSFIGGASLDLYDFSLLMKSISKKKPKAIILDPIFGASEDDHPKKDEAFEILKSIDTPIFAGSFLSNSPIQYRSPLELNNKEYQLSNYAHGGETKFSFIAQINLHMWAIK